MTGWRETLIPGVDGPTTGGYQSLRREPHYVIPKDGGLPVDISDQEDNPTLDTQEDVYRLRLLNKCARIEYGG